MKSLVIYYSLEGNTKCIAEHISAAINADVIRLIPDKQPAKKGFMKFFWGGKQVMMNEIPSLKPLEKDPESYDVIFIGTPVWAWSYAPALAAFFSSHDVKNKKIGLFCCHGGGKGKTLEKMEAELTDNTVIGKIDFKDPLKHNTESDKARAAQWAENLISSLK